MFRLAPGAEDHFIALRTALGVFLPLTLLIAIDRMELAVCRTQRPALTPRVRRAIWGESFEHVLAAGLAGSVATLLSSRLSTGHNYWAMVAAVVPLVGQTTRHQVVRGIHRVLGTFAGLSVMAAVSLLAPNPWVAVLIMGLMQFGTEMFVARNYFWAQVFVTPLALVGTGLGVGFSTSLLYDRMVETRASSSLWTTCGKASRIRPWNRRRPARACTRAG
jgi:hypothetical protein